MATIVKIPRNNGYAFKAIIRRRGRVLKTKTFQTKTAAREWARRTESSRELADAADDPGLHLTLAELGQRYVAAWSGRDAYRRAQVRWWEQHIGPTKLAHITVERIRNLLTLYREGRDREPVRARAPASVNRMKSALSAMFTFAGRQGLTHRNPARQIPVEPEHNHRIRYLSEDERIRLLAACRQSRWDRLYLLVLMAIMTGARKGELLALRWEQIDFANREARLEHTKNAEPRVLTFPPPVIEELMRFRRPSGVLFASPVNEAKPANEHKTWQVALKSAGIESFRFHDLRHSAASYLAMSGASLLEVAEVLGHRSLQTTKRYAHLSVSHKRMLTDRVLGGLAL